MQYIPSPEVIHSGSGKRSILQSVVDVVISAFCVTRIGILSRYVIYCLCSGFRDVRELYLAPVPARPPLTSERLCAYIYLCFLNGSSYAERVLKLQTKGDL